MRTLIILLSFIFFNLVLSPLLISASSEDERKLYIVYMGELPDQWPMESLVDEHHNLLREAIQDERLARDSKVHSYGKSFNGFAARLFPHEAQRLSQNDRVVSVFPNTVQKLLTTRSWDFLGMPEFAMRNLITESNIIVGLLDTGVYMGSPSFNDEGFGPPPSKWKGKCAKPTYNFTGCNNKVIGAQYFSLNDDNGTPHPDDGQPTPVDYDGHGSHTASTAAGIAVRHASLYGLGEGTARGGVPSARIAMYKVCWQFGCEDVNLLAAFDAAIADGVDVLSVSIGGLTRPFYQDPIAIGSFHAMKKGIVTACAAGNYGPSISTIQNPAPWVTTVAATSLDRQFQADVKLGNGDKLTGIAINTFSPKKTIYPLTSGAKATNISGDIEIHGNGSACDSGTLMENKVKGKIVFCLGSSGQDSTINDYKGIGTIMAADNSIQQLPFSFLIPATVVDAKSGRKIDQYINSTKKPQGIIYKSKGVKIEDAPYIASFSARGPQLISLNILKPDIAAPGLSILAAYSPLATMTGYDGDKRYVTYNIISGTSMSTPHVAGAMAYVKSFHPTWSPAAIKSALMTTATPMKIKPMEAELATGSGQVNPIKALDPGLIYDINVGSYVRFLCKEGYNSTTIHLMTGGKKRYNCSTLTTKGFDGLNYPSMHIQLNNHESNKFSAVFYRIVTNVGEGKSEYKAEIHAPKGVSIKVSPRSLTFQKTQQRRSFKVEVSGELKGDDNSVISASLVWSDSKHTVKTPILICKTLVEND